MPPQVRSPELSPHPFFDMGQCPSLGWAAKYWQHRSQKEESAMHAHDIMTKDVVTVFPQTTVHDIARLLVDKRIGSVPVVSDANDVIGIVTESDLLHREEIHTERKRKWWLELFVGAETQAHDFVKTHGLRAEHVMSRVVTAVPPDADLADVAEILDTH